MARSREGREHADPAVPACDGDAEPPREPLRHGRLKAERAHGFRLAAQHLINKIVQDEPVVPGEPADESCSVLVAVEGTRRPPRG